MATERDTKAEYQRLAREHREMLETGGFPNEGDVQYHAEKVAQALRAWQQTKEGR